MFSRFFTVAFALFAGAFAQADGDPRAAIFDELVRVELAKSYPGARIELKERAGFDQAILGAGIKRITLLGDNGRGEASFAVEPTVTTAESKPLHVSVRFSAWLKGWRAAKRVTPGQVLASDSFVEGEADVSSGLMREFRGVVFSGDLPVEGFEASQTVMAGQFLLASAARRIPDIKRGEIVQIRMISGGITLSTMGMAAEPGYLDGAIRVLTQATKKELSGKLQSGRIVEVAL